MFFKEFLHGEEKRYRFKKKTPKTTQTFVLGLLIQIDVCLSSTGAALGDLGPFQIFKSLVIGWHLSPLPRVYPNKLIGKRTSSLLHSFAWESVAGFGVRMDFFFVITNLFNKIVLHFWVSARVFWMKINWNGVKHLLLPFRARNIWLEIGVT